MDGDLYPSSPNPNDHELVPRLMKGEKEKEVPNECTDVDDIPNSGACGTKANQIPTLDSASDNSSEVRRRREELNYPPRYPDLQRVAWSESKNTDNQIDVSPMDFGFVSDSEDGSDDPTDEFLDKPRFRGVIEWIVCLLLDCVLLVVEVGVSLWLASSLYDHGLELPYKAIPIILVLPSFINPMMWLKVKASYKLSTCFVLMLLFLGFPSPLFVYIWHLYLSMFAKKSDAEKAKHLANTFRLIQAFVTSVPLLLLSLVTIINALKVSGQDALNITYLGNHLHQVEMHGLAFIVSLINLLRASSLFNERETFTLLYVLVGCPFLLLTAISRILSLGIIIAFLDVEWIAILGLGLIFANIVLYMLCRKKRQQRYYNTSTHAVSAASAPNCIDDVDHAIRIVEIRPSKKHSAKDIRSKYISPIKQNPSTSSMEPALDDMACESSSTISHNSSNHRNGCSHCCGAGGRATPDSDGGKCHNRSYTYAINPESPEKALRGGRPRPAGTITVSHPHEESVWSHMPKTILLSVCSIVMPSGYSNDNRSQHPRLKGGLFLMLNYFFTNLVLGVALGFSILRHVPNVFQGVKLPPLAADIRIPDSNINVNIGGLLDVGINLPKKTVSLGEMPPIEADIDLGSKDHLFAVIAPLILAMVVLPFVTMRAAMMELDCFIARRKSLVDVERIQGYKSMQKRRKKSSQQFASTPTNSSGHSSRGLIRNNQTLVETVAKNTENKELKSRMYVTLCCSVVGMAILTFVSMLLGALIYISMSMLK